MHIPSTDISPNVTLEDQGHSLDVIVEAYHQSMRYHTLLQARLTQALDQSEREAHESAKIAKERLKHIHDIRQSLMNEEPERKLEDPTGPSRVEASTWRWFHEGAAEKSMIRSQTPDSILSGPLIRTAVKFVGLPDDIQEREFVSKLIDESKVPLNDFRIISP